MKKLYEKQEIWFAVLWIVIYVMVMGNLRDSFGDASLYSLSGVSLIAAVLTIFIRKYSLEEKYGLRKVGPCRNYLYFLPFVFLATINLWAGVRIRYGMPGQIFALCTMAVVGYVEELLFRGFLFRAIRKSSLTQAIVISAVTFGVGHIVNLLTGQATLETFLQMAYAVAIGFAFVMVVYRSQSIWPCIVTHSLINMTSTLAVDWSETMELAGAALILLVAGGYAIYLWKGRNRGAESDEV